MNSFKIEDYNAVALLQALRDALMMPHKKKRKAIFTGIANAMKGLRLVSAKDSILGIYEGVDANGDHWFMCEMKDDGTSHPIPSTSSHLPEAGDEQISIPKAEMHLAHEELSSIIDALREDKIPDYCGMADRLARTADRLTPKGRN